MYLNLKAFIFSLFIGFLGVYVTPPEYILVEKKPTKLNLDTIYTNEFGDCYVYEKEEVKCTENALDII